MKRVNSIDLDTGEILEYSLVAIQRKVPNGFRAGWIAMAQSAMEMLATSIKSLDDYRVLLMLLARLDFENLTNISQVEIAEKLGMQKQNVNRSIKRLIDVGCLLEGPTVRRNRTYKLNPNYGWKGSGKEHQKALRAHEKAAAAGLKVHAGGKTSTDYEASE
jgi:biotin operon repressor